MFSTSSDDEQTAARKMEIYLETEKIIEVVNSGDYEGYLKMACLDMTAFEPQAQGNLVVGMEFHKYYFDTALGKRPTRTNTTILSPHIHLLGENAASISYIRLTQFTDSTGTPHTKKTEETRVWKRSSTGQWKMVHLHRSVPPSDVGSPQGAF